MFNGLITSFFPVSFVSVKGPGRKLSLPTDLKSDLGTVGRKRAVFLWTFFLSFESYTFLLIPLPRSCWGTLVCLCSLLFFPYVAHFLSLDKTDEQQTPVYSLSFCVRSLKSSFFQFVECLLCVHFASVYKGSLYLIFILYLEKCHSENLAFTLSRSVHSLSLNGLAPSKSDHFISQHNHALTLLDHSLSIEMPAPLWLDHLLALNSHTLTWTILWYCFIVIGSLFYLF